LGQSFNAFFDFRFDVNHISYGFRFFCRGIGTWLEERKQAAGKIRIGSGTVLVLLVFRVLLPTKIECPMSQ